MKKLKFVHITKCGGTTIENIAKKNNVYWGRFDNEYKKAISENEGPLKIDLWHYAPRYMKPNKLKYILDKYDFFTVVRNPYSRMISEYYSYWGPKHNITENKDQFNKTITEFLEQTKEKLRNIDDLLCCHYIPQWLYLLDKDGNIIIRNIIKQENLNDEFNQLMTTYGYSIRLSRNNKNNPALGDKFTVKDLSKKNIDLINEIYQKDFELFGYEMIHRYSSKKNSVKQNNNKSKQNNNKPKQNNNKTKQNNHKQLKNNNREESFFETISKLIL